MPRKKAVISADPAALAEVESLVEQGTYPTVSAFVREAIAEKLARVRGNVLREQVEFYCRLVGTDDENEHADEQRRVDDLLSVQSYSGDP